MIIFRYLSKELYSNLLAITLVLLIILITNQFVHYLKDAASGRITMTAVAEIMTLQVPILLGYLLPIGLYLSILFTFGRWYMDHEMSVLSACGVSRSMLLGYTLIFATIVTIFVAWLMLWAEPVVQNFRTRILTRAVTEASMEKVVPGRFQMFGDGNVYYAGHLSRAKHQMYDVFLAQRSKHQPGGWDVTVAEVANQKTLAGKGRYIVFDDGYRYLGAPGEKNFQLIKYKEYGIKLESSSRRLNDFPFTATTKSLWDDRHTNKRAAAAFQWRLALPISVILLALLAVPLSKVNPRKGKFARLIPAILIYIVYVDFLFMGRAWIEKGAVSPAVGLWWIHIAALALATLLLSYYLGWWRYLFSRRMINAHA